jgi:hypothetical protein
MNSNLLAVMLVGVVLMGSVSSQSAKKNDTMYAFGKQCAAMFSGKASLLDKTAGNPESPTALDIKDNAVFSCEETEKTSTLTLNFDPSNSGIGGDPVSSVTLNFEHGNQYWLFTEGVVKTSKREYGMVYMEAPYGMETPHKFSFACTKTHFRLIDQNDKNKKYVKVEFYIEYLQFQPYDVSVNETNYTFGKVNYCQGFFTSGIWMAITVSLLLAFILAFGVSMLFNIQPMDRFDDPKGKPLMIAQEK